MSGMDFEYAIKKDIRNNPIVREVDEARQRQLWRTMGIGLFLVVVLLFSAWQHFEMLRHGYQIERMQQERAAEERSTHLRSSRDAARAAPHRADRDRAAAPRRAPPGPGIVIERGTPAAAPRNPSSRPLRPWGPRRQAAVAARTCRGRSRMGALANGGSEHAGAAMA